MKKLPLVSIIIRTYNQEEFVSQAIQSAIGQTYQNIQVVIVDDCSTDKTPDIISFYAKKYPDIVELYFNDENVGELVNFNIALGYCKGTYIAILDGDDIYYQEKIKTQVDFLLKNEQFAFCYHDAHVFKDVPDNIIYNWSSRFGKRKGNSVDLARYGPYPSTTSTLLRKKYLPIEGFNNLLSTQADWLLLIDILESSGRNVGYIDKILAGIRIHKNNVSGNWPNKLASRFKTIEIAYSKYPHLKQHLYKYYADLLLVKSFHLFSQKHYGLSVKTFIKTCISAFPNLLMLLRLPLREILFHIKNRMIPHPFKSRMLE